MIVGIMPTMAFADVALTVEDTSAPLTGTDKAIQLVTGGTVANITGAQASNIYFGTYQQSAKDGGYNVDPIKWRVLSNADGKLFLLADQAKEIRTKFYDFVKDELGGM